MNIEARKIALVKQILSLQNELLIKELEAKLVQLIPRNLTKVKNKKSETQPSKKKHKTPPITKIRKNVSLETIVSEQKTIPITYKEIQVMNKDITWEQSLEELLKALN